MCVCVGGGGGGSVINVRHTQTRITYDVYHNHCRSSAALNANYTQSSHTFFIVVIAPGKTDAGLGGGGREGDMRRRRGEEASAVGGLGEVKQSI